MKKKGIGENDDFINLTVSILQIGNTSDIYTRSKH